MDTVNRTWSKLIFKQICIANRAIKASQQLSKGVRAVELESSILLVIDVEQVTQRVRVINLKRLQPSGYLIYL